MPRMFAIAQIINHQTEWWNGSGQPAGLAGEEISLESRILGLVAEFQSRVNQLETFNSNGKAETRESILAQALAECKRESGDRWDPKLVDTLEILVVGLQQGLSLPVTPPKISGGMWLIDAQFGSDTNSTEQKRVRSRV